MKSISGKRHFSGRGKKALLTGAFLVSSCAASTVASSSSSSEEKTSEEEILTSYPMVEGVETTEGLSYEIFVASFADSNGDGIGDFKGIEEKADYIASLGVNQVWLMPIHPTSSYHGYDVNDYYGVNSKYGTMDDFVSMVNTLKNKGVDVIIDMVLNHSGKNNPWFRESYNDFVEGKDPATSKSDWYVFKEEGGMGYYQYGDFYYEGNFSASMPEFNYDSLGWRNEVKNILRFWIEKGVKGFRFDAVLYFYYGDDKSNTEVCRFLRESVDEIQEGIYLVGEGWKQNGTLLNYYYPSGLGSFFDFAHSNAYDNTFLRFGKGMQNGTKFAKEIENLINKVKAADENSYPSFFISNHDTNRLSNNVNNDNDLKMTQNVIYLMPGTPYIYYGEEQNLYGVRGNEGSDGMRRLPMVWSNKEGAKYNCEVPDSTVRNLAERAKPWAEHSIEELEEDPLSTVNHLRKVGNVRNRLKGLRHASIEAIELEDSALMAYTLHADSDYIVYHNSYTEPKTIVVGEGLEIFDSIDILGKRPVYSGNSLTINGLSSVIMKAK